MNNMEIDDDVHMPVLNRDVLSEIFKYLSHCDRKCAKLVCTEWLEVCRYREFTDEKVISISYFHNHVEIKKIIAVFPEEKLNLKFTDQRFFKRSLEFFVDYGPRIEYLQFYKCDFSSTALPQILLYCANLRELVITKCGKIFVYGKNDPRSVLRFKGNASMKNENLIILRLNENEETFSLAKKELKFIASAFPNLRSLKISLNEYSGNNSSNEYSENSSSNEYSGNKVFSVLLNLLENELRHLESIHVNFPALHANFNVDHLSALPSLVALNERLRNVSLSCSFVGLSSSIMSCSTYKFWTSLAFIPTPFSNEGLSANQLVFLLHELPLLRELKFPIISSVCTTVNDFCILCSALIRSNLKSLKIIISLSPSQDFIRQAELRMNTSMKNTTVRNLGVEEEGFTFYTFFVKYFSKVDDLYMDLIQFTSNFIYPDELLSLDLNIETDVSCSQDIISSKTSLERLEFLYLRFYAKSMFSFYRFPNLKYLKIDFPVFYKSDKSELELTNLESVLMQESPQLEGIMFSSKGFTSNIFSISLRFARKFHNLRYICLLCSCRQKLAKRSDLLVQVREWFNQCPSLKAVWIRVPEFHIYYFFNVITKKYEVFNNYKNIADNDSIPVDLKDLWRKKRSEMRLI